MNTSLSSMKPYVTIQHDIKDAVIATPTTNQALVYTSSKKWQNTTLSSSVLSDFNISTPLNEQFLQYNTSTSKWVNATVTKTLSSLTDVNLSSLKTNHTLTYDGNQWVNSSQWQMSVFYLYVLGDEYVAVSESYEYTAIHGYNYLVGMAYVAAASRKLGEHKVSKPFVDLEHIQRILIVAAVDAAGERGHAQIHTASASGAVFD